MGEAVGGKRRRRRAQCQASARSIALPRNMLVQCRVSAQPQRASEGGLLA